MTWSQLIFGITIVVMLLQTGQGQESMFVNGTDETGQGQEAMFVNGTDETENPTISIDLEKIYGHQARLCSN